MSKRSKGKQPAPAEQSSLLLDPQQRLCPSYDSVSISLQLEPSRNKMGIRVVDNCAEEHRM